MNALKRSFTALLLCCTLFLIAQEQLSAKDPVYWWLDPWCNKDCSRLGLPNANIHGWTCAFPNDPQFQACWQPAPVGLAACLHSTECRVLRMIRPPGQSGEATVYRCDCLYSTNAQNPDYNTDRVPSDEWGNPLPPPPPWWPF